MVSFWPSGDRDPSAHEDPPPPHPFSLLGALQGAAKVTGPRALHDLRAV